MTAKDYLSNCFWLLLPVFGWNVLLYQYLPIEFQGENFDKDVPTLTLYAENVLRIFIFGLPLVMTFSLKTKRQKIGFTLFLLGILLYFSSWIALILYPQIQWSRSLMGLLAPAYTTLLWLIGISLIGNKSVLKIKQVSIIYMIISVLFVLVHTYHAYVVFES